MSRYIKKYLHFILIIAATGMFSMPHAAPLSKPFIAYTDVGEGTPLVLIHAFPTSEKLWEPQRAGLKHNFRVITLDLYGFGLSSLTETQALTMDDYAKEVKVLLDHLQISKAIIGGESMGGYVSLAFLKNYPDNVLGLILSNTQSIADSDEAKAKRELTARDVLAHGSKTLIEGFMPKALSNQASHQLRASLLNLLEAQSTYGIASALRGMALRSDTSSVLANTKLPVLIITSDQDTLIPPAQSKSMKHLATNSRLVVIPDAAHLSNLEQPDQWNQAVINMFAHH